MRANERKLTPTYNRTNHRLGFSRQAPSLHTQRGAASLYVVIFTTLLLSVITLSFIRIMISENSQTSNSDLSESAYDSAQAGLEDAKVALLRYHDCLSGRSTAGSAECSGIVSRMQNGISSDSCDTVRDVLNRPANTAEGKDEVLVKETANSTSADLLQAYTCVKIYEDLDDYRTTLSSNFRSRLVPLRTRSNTNNINAQTNNINKITVSWFSRANNNGGTGTNMMGTSYFMPIGGNAYYPPVLAVSLIQASANGFNPYTDFNVPNGGRTNRAEVFLRPGGSTTSISASEYASTQNKTPEGNGPRVQNVRCNGLTAGEFACSVDIYLPEPINGLPRNNNATFLKLDLPYGTPTTDVSITMSDGSNNLINFYGVQAKVDSTGRANDLYRRVETRVELVDIYYPYPEFTLQSDGTNYSDAISKNFYSTRNCWAADDGSTRDCPQNTQRNY